jgi:sporulation protein YlmC with PRC-barrel domain
MQPEKAREPRIVKAYDDLIGKKISNLQGEELGEIKELMIDATAGRVTYAILSFGGFMGLGDKLFAVPWVSLSYDPARDRFVMNADKELLANAPGFDKDHWPNMSDSTWSSTVHKYYSVKL